MKFSSQIKKIVWSLGMAAFVLFVLQLKVEWPQSSQANTGSQTPSSKHWVEKSESERKSSLNSEAASFNKAFISLAETASPAVVNIYTKSRMPVRRQFPGGFGGSQEDLFRFFFGNPFGEPMPNPQPREAQSLGSGFVIHSSGLIVTNSHVVRPTGRNADTVLVKFNTDSEKSEGHAATIVGVDESTDVAVLRLKKIPKDLKTVALGNSDGVKVGEWVVAIGNPYGHSHSVTKGIVSALGRNISEGLGSNLQRANFIQTDASINPGNSGGPLLNIYGEVIGINTAIDARAQGIGFAVPVNVAKTVISQILEKGQVTLGWIGVALSDLTPQIAKSLKLPDSDGAFIQEVMPGGPADKAGMLAYDVVREINQKKVSSDRDLWQMVSGAAPGTALKFKVLRDGQNVELNLVVSARPSEKDLGRRQGRETEEEDDFSQGTDASFVGKTGMSLMELSGELRRRLRLDAGTRGAVVHRLDPEGPAAMIGVQPGDLIVEVDRKPVRNAVEAKKALSAKKDSFLLRIIRGTASVIVLLDVSSN